VPMRRELYPRDWPAISRAIRERAGQTRECVGECGDAHDDGRCGAPNGRTIRRVPQQPARWYTHDGCSLCLNGDPECRPVMVVLTVAHMDHTPANCAPENLRALCQRCHLRYDREHHARNAAHTRRSRKAAGDLPGV
jgi:hypothetical protein